MIARRIACALALLGCAQPTASTAAPRRSSVATTIRSSAGAVAPQPLPPQRSVVVPAELVAINHRLSPAMVPVDSAPTVDVGSSSVLSLRASTVGASFIRLRLSPAERIAAARLIVNEDSRPLRSESDGGTAGAITLDGYAILQVVHDFAHWTGRSHGAALRALSPHVAGGKPATQRRHALYRTLPARGAQRPALWLDAIDGPWSEYAGNWERLRDGVAEAIELGFPAPCPPVVAWGNEGDDSIAQSRRLVRVPCAGPTRNRFWARAVVAAREASGRP